MAGISYIIQQQKKKERKKHIEILSNSQGKIELKRQLRNMKAF